MAAYYYSTTTSSCDSTWSTWNTPCYTTTSGTTDATWYRWNHGIVTATTVCSSATADTTATWDYWNNSYKVVNFYEAKPIELTEEQKAAQEKQRLKLEEENRQRQLKEKEKEEKARQLLREVLSDEQNEQLDKERYFELVSINSGRKYRIRKGRSRNIEEIDGQGKRLRSLCFHPDDYLHDYDTLAIQKLMLENDEEEVLKVANFS